jgi:threonine dehydrogenase-like Zn-dependent dehydrogenase
MTNVTVFRGAKMGTVVDVTIEAVACPATFEIATELIRPDGTVATVGVHGKGSRWNSDSRTCGSGAS